MTTLNLPFRRWVAQVSTGTPRSKSTYLALMAENLTALQACPWREAADVPVALTGHDFTASYLSDAFDAYKMTGKYDSTAMTEIGYAGMAAYRFKVPADATTRSVALSSVALPISRDRFLRSGVHVGVELTDSETPSGDWATVRGAGALSQTVLSQSTVANLLAGDVGSDTLTVDLSGITGSGNPQPYLWVYLTLEDYTDAWEMYDVREKRLYAIEGSAMLVGGSAEVTFAGDVTPDSAAGPAVLADGVSSPTWLQPLPTVNAYSENPPALSNIFQNLFTSLQTDNVILSNAIQGTLVLELNGRYPYTIALDGKTVTSVTIGEHALDASGDGSWFAQWTSAGVTFTANVLYVNFSSEPDPDYARVAYKITLSSTYGAQSTSASQTWQESELYHVASTSTYYLMLQLKNGVPYALDKSATDSETGRYHLSSSVSGTESPWTLTLAGTEIYTVTISGSSQVTLSDGTRTFNLGTSTYDPLGNTAFDIAANVRLPGGPGNGTVVSYGIAAALGDFSHAVATFEPGDQPSNAELLGRLARMSKKSAQGMLYLHPAVAALADELDALRPVPRFFRVASPPPQATCQPGLSVWYYRPHHATEDTPPATVIDPSVASAAKAYMDGSVSVVKVANPVFLQLTVLALRAPSSFSARLVLENKNTTAGANDTTVAAAVANPFRLRFVAWASPADQWDGSNAFAMAAMASMPSVYRSDGEDSVSWQVDCSGALAPFGVRTMTARRIGVSEVLETDIPASDGIVDIPLVGDVNAGDVVLIAPEVLGFNAGTDDDPASACFGRQSAPSASANGGAWARYAQDLGWFPKVTGE